MGYSQAYNAYKRTSVTTASQGELIVLLYEGAVSRLTAAVSLFDLDDKLPVKNIEAFSEYVLKTQEIITELQVSLDLDKGGDIAKNLMSLYVYFNQELMNANINKSRAKVQFVLDMLKQLTESWKQAASSTANTPVTKVQQALNIHG